MSVGWLLSDSILSTILILRETLYDTVRGRNYFYWRGISPWILALNGRTRIIREYRWVVNEVVPRLIWGPRSPQPTPAYHSWVQTRQKSPVRHTSPMNVQLTIYIKSTRPTWPPLKLGKGNWWNPSSPRSTGVVGGVGWVSDRERVPVPSGVVCRRRGQKGRGPQKIGWNGTHRETLV